jgi:hypothetical protein
MRRPRLVIILISLVLASIIALRNQSGISAKRAQIAQCQAKLEALKAESATLREELAAIQVRLQKESAARNATVTSLAAEVRKRSEVDPESLWANPPSALPDWDNESPYVWLSKEILPSLPIVAFSKDGELDPTVAAMLTLSPSETRELNHKLRTTLEKYRALESAGAEISTNHLPGIQSFPGEKLTIVVNPLPDEGDRLKEEFSSAIKSHLGEQRSGLALHLARYWLSEQFSHQGAEPKTISAVRHGDGRFNLSIQTAGSSMSTGGHLNFEDYVPAHLLPYFTAFQEADKAPAVR